MGKNLNLLLFVGAVITLSFLLFSSVFYPLLNSDDGITLLMIHNFRLPEDIYFWDQDRGGSIIPLLAQIFHKGFGLSLLWSEAIVHYSILILGYFSFSTLLKSNYSKIIFAVAWFLPLYYFLGLIRYPFGLHYSFLAIGIYLINRYQKRNYKPTLKYLLLCSIFLIFLVSVWSSDMAIVSISLVLLYYGIRSYQSKKSVKKFVLMPETIFTFLGYILGVLSILGLKSTAKLVSASQYNLQYFNSYDELIQAFSLLKKILITFFSFKVQDPPVSIYAYLVIILLSFVLVLKIKGEKTQKVSSWAKVFLIDGIIFIAIILLSNWAYKNGLARRYFTGVYITFWLAFLMYLECFVKTRLTMVVKGIAILLVAVGVYSTIYGYQYIRPKRFTPKAEVVKEFEALGKIGIIAGYWSSYGVSFVNPNLIKATPHDKSTVRNYELVDSVFNQPKLYLIRDGWMDTFPNTINQFGRKLNKKGTEFYMGDCWVNEYEVEH